MEALSRNVLAFVRRLGLLRPADKVVLGLSGGPDSVALVLVLAGLARSGDLPVEISLAHLHHGLRGAESDEDEAFCSDLAERLALPLTVGHARGLKAGRGSAEARAREARYSFLGRIALQAGAGAVATGHQADDAAETVLMRMLRGSALAGLGGMAAARPLGPDFPGIRLVRPLLDATRDDVLRFLCDCGQDYRVDASNRDIGFTRNRVRHELIPALRRMFPTFSTRALAALNESAREATLFIRAALDEEWEAVLRSADDASVVLEAGVLARLAPPLRKEAVRRAAGLVDAAAARALSADQLRSAALLAEARVGAQVSLPGGLAARRDHGAVIVGRPPAGGAVPARLLPVPGALELPEAGLVLRSEALGPGRIGPDEAREISSATDVYVDATGLDGPVTVRCRRPGDRFRPLGAPGSMRLKQFFIDQGVPRHRRDGVPLVLAPDGQIVWVVGLRIAHAFRLTGRDAPVVRLRALPSGGEAGR
jgi:tRNA(Ile)-lysidine synthase